MLELRPNCEHCDKSLPPGSGDAMICTFECTFCRNCVTNTLANVCPNCGGGFAPRPVRPAVDRVGGNYLGNHPARTSRLLQPVDPKAQAALIEALGSVPPERR